MSKNHYLCTPMTRRFRLIAIMSLCCLSMAAAESATWEQTDAVPRTVAMERLDTETNTAIATAGEYIYIETARPIEIKLFTILGQLIGRRQLEPGIHRIRIASRGIYLIKVGSVTRRVVI